MDEFECYSWAKQQSGFDPMAASQATTPLPQQQSSGGGALEVQHLARPLVPLAARSRETPIRSRPSDKRPRNTEFGE